jgi:hypothetical protein
MMAAMGYRGGSKEAAWTDSILFGAEKNLMTMRSRTP